MRIPHEIAAYVLLFVPPHATFVGILQIKASHLSKQAAGVFESLTHVLPHAQPRISVMPGSVISDKADKQTAVDRYRSHSSPIPLRESSPLRTYSLCNPFPAFLTRKVTSSLHPLLWGFLALSNKLVHLTMIAPAVDQYGMTSRSRIPRAESTTKTLPQCHEDTKEI